jgi:hypothetical protein
MYKTLQDCKRVANKGVNNQALEKTVLSYLQGKEYQQWVDSGSEEEFEQAITELPPLGSLPQEIKEIFIKKAHSKFNKAVKDITDKYPLHERETWHLQLAQAKDYLDNLNTGSLLQAIATSKDLSVEDMSNRIVQKDIEYQSVLANALAIKNETIRALEEDE